MVRFVGLLAALALGSGAFAESSRPAGSGATSRPTTRGMSSADAVKEVDRRELIEGLRDDDDAGSVMARILSRMQKSYERLAQAYDSGAVTREIQRRIVADLAKALEAARQREKQPQSSPQSQPSKQQQDKQKSQRPKQQGKKPEKKNGKKDGKKDAGADARGRDKPAGRIAAGKRTQAARAGPIEETRRTWGNVPPRDRDEVVQGSEEKTIRKYAEQVERYYEALSSEE